MSLDLKGKGINTRVTHAGENPDSVHGSVSVPIYQTSTFKFRDVDHGSRLFTGEEEGYIYTRVSNPTINTTIANKKTTLLKSIRSLYVVSWLCEKSTTFMIALFFNRSFRKPSI